MSKAAGASKLAKLLQVRPGSHPSLSKVDAGETHGYDRDDAERIVAADLERLTSLQERIWAERRNAILILLQGIDTAGKDGTIRHVMQAFNPRGCRVTSFGVPTPVEDAHDHLWRIHAVTPAAGEIAIFNRSHYEGLLVVRVHDLVPRERWEKRYEQINDFERELADEGTTILKFFLHIDRDEQGRRLQDRLDDPTKRWKFQVGDLAERRRWDDYQAAYEDVLARCSTDVAPWYLVPANRKWFRNLAVGSIIADRLDDLDPRYPQLSNLPKTIDLD